MNVKIESLSKERQLILICTKSILTEDDIKKVISIMNSNPDWKEILYQGTIHRVLNIMFYNLKKLQILDKVDDEILKIMKTQYTVYKERNTRYYEEIKLICSALNKNNIRAAILKGNYLSKFVYPTFETRSFNDLDFLIDIKDANKIVEILESIGYIQGDLDKNTGEIIPGTPQQKRMHRIATHELMECLKKTDHPFTPVIQVDLNFDILWGGNCPYKINSAELLGKAREIDMLGEKAYVLDFEDFLIQLACHLYKEAALIHWITDLRDLKLYKFSDIMIYINKFSDQINWDKLIKTSQQYGIEKIMYFVFYYINLIYGEVVPEKIMSILEPENKDYLNEYGVEKEKPFKWQHDFFTRLFETSRIMELSDEVKGKDFLEARK
jgi:hypothetical protein